MSTNNTECEDNAGFCLALVFKYLRNKLKVVLSSSSALTSLNTLAVAQLNH